MLCTPSLTESEVVRRQAAFEVDSLQDTVLEREMTAWKADTRSVHGHTIVPALEMDTLQRIALIRAPRRHGIFVRTCRLWVQEGAHPLSAVERFPDDRHNLCLLLFELVGWRPWAGGMRQVHAVHKEPRSLQPAARLHTREPY